MRDEASRSSVILQEPRFSSSATTTPPSLPRGPPSKSSQSIYPQRSIQRPNSPPIRPEQIERPLPRELCVLRAIIGAAVGIEAMACVVDVNLHFGMQLLHFLDGFHRNAVIVFAEMQDRRT